MNTAHAQPRPTLTPTYEQRRAYAFIRGLDCASLVASPGAGKTLPAAGLLMSRWQCGEIAGAVIVTTTIGVEQWRRKLLEYYPTLYEKMQVRGNENYLAPAFFSITSYTQYRNDARSYRAADLEKMQVILDESHKIKSYSAKQTRVVFKYLKRARYRLLLSGTPVGVGHLDLFTQYLFLRVAGFPTKKSDFIARYCKTIEQTYGFRSFQKVVGYKNVSELTALIKQVAYSFKPKEEREHYSYVHRFDCDDTEDAARQAKVHLRNYAPPALVRELAGEDESDAQSQIDNSLLRVRAQQARWLFDEYDAPPTLVFYFYRKERDILAEVFDDCATGLIYGGLQTKKKHDVIDAFQRGELNVIIAQVRTIRESIDIQAGKLVVFTHPCWSVIDYRQAVGRIKRKGQESNTIDVILVARDTVDEAAKRILHRREKQSDRLVAEIAR